MVAVCGIAIASANAIRRKDFAQVLRQKIKSHALPLEVIDEIMSDDNENISIDCDIESHPIELDDDDDDEDLDV